MALREFLRWVYVWRHFNTYLKIPVRRYYLNLLDELRWKCSEGWWRRSDWANNARYLAVFVLHSLEYRLLKKERRYRGGYAGRDADANRAMSPAERA